MDPKRNRWTNQPHLHLRERARRARQLRRRLMRQLLIADMVLGEVEHLFPHRDSFAAARAIGRLAARPRPPE